MKIIITMAGLGSRFREAGYTVPKHEIVIKNKTLFEWSLLSLIDFFDEEFIFITRKGTYNLKFIEEICNKLDIKKYKIKELDHLTDGQASTAFLCNDLISEDESVLIYNIDTYVKEYSILKSNLKKYDGFIPVFKAQGEKWSFIKIDENNKVIDVVEKIRISDLASIGLYYFKNWKDYKKIYLKYKEEIKKDFKEVYIAPMYRYLLQDKKEIGYIILNEEDVHILGTPEDLKKFN